MINRKKIAGNTLSNSGLVLIMLLMTVSEAAVAQQLSEAGKLINAANKLTNNGKDDEAIVLYKKAISLEPRNDLAYFDLGTTYALGKHDFEKARGYFQKTIELNPKSAAAWHNLGMSLKNLKNLKDAKTALERAVTLAPNDCSCLCDLAYIYMDLGRLKDAQGLLLKANELPEAKTSEFKDIATNLKIINKQLSSKNN